MAFATASLFSGAAYGQTTTGAPETGAAGERPQATTQSAATPEQVNADGSSAAGGDIVVTGSRIRLPNLQSNYPIVTIGSQYLEERNLTNVADALNNQPGFRGSVTPNGAQGSFGQGVNFVNALGLGSNRTLTLINGRRFVTSNVTTLFGQGSQGTQVDLNVINTLLVDHVDNISIGGAPVYGSDAIAGTVNIILRDRYNGVIATALSGVTEQGDGFRYNLSLVAGTNFAGGRGNVTIAYSRDRQDGILYNDRDFLRQNLGNATNPTSAQAAALGRAAGITYLNDGRVNTGIGFNDSTTDGFPGTVLARDLSIYYLTQGGLITATNAAGAAAVQNYQFDASGNLVRFNRGIVFPGINASGGDGFRFNDYSQVTSNLKRDIYNAFAHFDVSDALQFFVETEYFHSRGDELVQQPTFNSNLFSGSSGPLTFSVNSPFLTTQARSQLQALGVTVFQVSRASADLADLTGFSTTDIYRVVGGARGDFHIGGRNFNYEISGNYGRTDITDTSQDLNRQNFINAVNVTTNGAGQIVCTATPTTQAAPGGTPVADPNCVPLNLLGAGLSSQAARNYVIATNKALSRLQQYVVTANVGGSPFSIFGNEAGFNVGYEHRNEVGRFTPSTFQQLGLGRSVAIAPVAGSYNVDEVFGEATIRIVQPQNNIGFINRLELTASGRHVDNTVNGSFFAWSAGGTFAPIRDIAFRGNYTKSFRAPAITELFLPQSNSFVTVPDLCSVANRNAGPAPATRARNCAAFLAAFPNATPLDAAAATVPGVSGGNANLQNEVSRSFTYGAVIQPRFIPGLSISADYIDIRIANPISNLTVATIASACFDNADFNTADPANGNAFCSQIKRYTAADGGTAVNGGSRAGQVVNNPANPGVVSGFVNGNRIFFSGIQGSVNYTTALHGLNLPGRFEIGVDGLYVRRRLVDITGVAPLRTDGTFGDPKFQAEGNVRYYNDTFGLSTSVNFIGRQIATRAALSPDLREFNTLKSYATVSSSIWINAGRQFRLTLNVDNLFNRVGQNYLGVIAPISYNDLFGRRFSASVRLRY